MASIFKGRYTFANIFFMLEYIYMEQQKIRVLLVDDNEVMRIMFRNIFWLHRLGDEYEITTVSTIHEAEEILTNPEKIPHIIFTGLVMPFTKDGGTVTSAEAGFTLLKRIKNDPVLSLSKVIIFSGYEDESFHQEALSLGAYQYLHKKESLPQDIIEAIKSTGKLITQ